VQQILGKTGGRREISDVYERCRGQKSGTVLQGSPHDDGHGSLVVCVPPCLLSDIFPTITVLESKIEFVVVQTKAVVSEMAVAPEVVEKRKMIFQSKTSNST
jgi:hypothetical protein